MTAVIDQIGGEDTVRAIVDRFYDLIETLPEGAQILHLHLRGHGMTHVRTEQFAFLSGFFGGRRYYAEKHGHMNLRDIHHHVPIRPKDAENWLFCMNMSLQAAQLAEPMHNQIMQAFTRAARILVNRSESDDVK